jgi:hypothetical protein
VRLLLFQHSPAARHVRPDRPARAYGLADRASPRHLQDGDVHARGCRSADSDWSKKPSTTSPEKCARNHPRNSELLERPLERVFSKADFCQRPDRNSASGGGASRRQPGYSRQVGHHLPDRAGAWRRPSRTGNGLSGGVRREYGPAVFSWNRRRMAEFRHVESEGARLRRRSRTAINPPLMIPELPERIARLVIRTAR